VPRIYPDTNRRIRACPICNRQATPDTLFMVELADVVCKVHQDWLVTRCGVCGRVSFSDCPGVCCKCMDDSNRALEWD